MEIFLKVKRSWEKRGRVEKREGEKRKNLGRKIWGSKESICSRERIIIWLNIIIKKLKMIVYIVMTNLILKEIIFLFYFMNPFKQS